MNTFFLLGYSGHAYVVADSIISEGNSIEGYYDLKENSENPFDLIYSGNEDQILRERILPGNFYFPAVGSNQIRKKMVGFLEKNEIPQTIVSHASAIISPSAKIENSAFISANAVLNSMCHVGKGCIINTGAIIEHECNIGEFSHIAPGAVLAGNVSIGTETFVGANSVIIQGKKIGKNVTIGAGSVVIQDIPDNETWVGNPAKRIK